MLRNLVRFFLQGIGPSKGLCLHRVTHIQVNMSTTSTIQTQLFRQSKSVRSLNRRVTVKHLKTFSNALFFLFVCWEVWFVSE